MARGAWRTACLLFLLGALAACETQQVVAGFRAWCRSASSCTDHERFEP